MALGLSGIASRLFFGDAESDTGSDMCRAQGEMITIDYRQSLKTQVSLLTQIRDLRKH